MTKQGRIQRFSPRVEIEWMPMIRMLTVVVFIFCSVQSSEAKDSLSFWKTNSFQKEIREDGRIRLSTEIEVFGEPKTVEVIFTPDVEEFAPIILQNSIRLIPVIARFLGIAPKQGVYTITHLSDKSTARNEGNTVLIPFNYPDPKKALPIPLLYHEIDHWWFGQNPRFISEGVSSFLPLALHHSGQLTLTPDEILEILNWWGFYNPTILKDIPLGDMEFKNLNEEESFSLHYQKTFKIQYILFQELGHDGYLKFLKSIIDYESMSEHFVQSVGVSQKTEGILNLLNQTKQINWKKILSGWLLTKDYSGVSISEWKDTDLDGLMDVEERYLGTNIKLSDTDKDGLNDGAEVALGTNPLVPDSPNIFENRLEINGPVLDGNASDWDFISKKKVATSLANPKIAGHFDLVMFQYFLVDDILYGFLKTRELPRIDKTTKGFYYFFVDQSTAAKTEGFGFWYASDARIGWEIRKEGSPEVVYGKVGEGFEFKIKIPKSDPKPKKLIPILRKTENVGFWRDYIPIEIEK